MDLGGVPTSVASSDDTIRSEEAAERPKDHLVLPALRHLRDAGRRPD